jgi:SWI/SNF-related matrix-associated actin-dependent regulator 1 of chromatin subfamily A
LRDKDLRIGKNLIDLISSIKRVILLTGCNLTKKPMEIYNLMKIVRPDVMPSFYEYGYRYCDPRQSFDGIDFSNAGNMIELK